MKRKLMLAMALTGNPRVVFLDEPTAGMDASARRDVWKLLLRKRQGRCIILCTHYMDEADILGDHIAVIHAGKLQDSGSSADLKVKYGKHTRLQLNLGEGADRRALMELVDSAATPPNSDASSSPFLPFSSRRVELDTSDIMDDEELLERVKGQILDSTEKGDLNLLLPIETELIGVLEALEAAKKDAGKKLVDFSVSAVNLSDVFWELEQQAAVEDEELAALNHPLQQNLGQATAPTIAQLSEGSHRQATTTEKILAMIKRNTISWKRELVHLGPIGIPMRELAYACILTASLLLTMIDFIPAPLPSSTVNLDPSTAFQSVSRTGVQYTVGSGSDSSHTASATLPYMKAWAAAPGSTLPLPVDGTNAKPCPLASLVKIIDPAVCVESYSNSDPPPGGLGGTEKVPYGFVASVSFDTNVSSIAKVEANPSLYPFLLDPSDFDFYYTIAPNTSVLASLPASVALLNSALLANVSGQDPSTQRRIVSSFTTLASESSSAESQSALKVQLNLLMAQFKSMFLIGVLSVMFYILAEWSRNIAWEKQQNVKQLQVLMGVTTKEYYAAREIWDNLHYLGIVVVPVVLACAFPTPLASYATVLLFLVFPFATMPLSYILGGMFTDPEQAYKLASGLGNFIFFLTFLPYFIFAIPNIVEGLNIEPATLEIVRIFLSLYPPTALAMGLRAVILSQAYEYDPMSVSVGPEDMQNESKLGLNLPTETAFAPFMILLIQGLLLFWLPPVLERCAGNGRCGFARKMCASLYNGCCRCSCCSCCYNKTKDQDDTDRAPLDAADVCAICHFD